MLGDKKISSIRETIAEAWSPLTNAGNLLKVHTLVEIGERYDKTPVQVVLRWHVQQGMVVIPKASHVDEENCRPP